MEPPVANEQGGERLCPICGKKVPRLGRGIVKCGHQFCFRCIKKWCCKQNECPLCRMEIEYIFKTLMIPSQVSKEYARRQVDEAMKLKGTNKYRARRRAARVQKHGDMSLKWIRVQPKKLQPTPAE